jgi:hypothetical protein
MENFTISKDVKHTVYYRNHYLVEAETREEAIKKFKEDEELKCESYLTECELLWDTLEEAMDEESPPYLEIDGDYFEI